MSENDVEALLRRERSNIAELLERAGVALEDAENLVTEALLAWDEAGRKPELIYVIDSRCREYARKRNRSYLGLEETRAIITKARAARSAKSLDDAPGRLAPELFTDRGPARRTKKVGRRRPRFPKGPGRR